MTTTTGTCNGFDLQQIAQAVELLSRQPDAARVTFGGSTSWDTHVATDGETSWMRQGGETVRRTYHFRGDHPPQLLGTDTGATAGELLLAALGACMAGTFAAHATVRGVQIHRLRVEVEGDLDLHGYFQLDDTRAGFSQIRTTFHVDADADQVTLAEIAHVVGTASPVLDSLRRGVDIRTGVRRAGEVPA